METWKGQRIMGVRISGSELEGKKGCQGEGCMK